MKLGNTPYSNMTWFMGVVEDVNDPKKLNRVRVRVFGLHSESRSDVAVDALPWAGFINSGSQMSAPMVLNGDWVIGFFLDGESAQQPIIFGSITGITPTAPDKTLGFFDPNGVYPKKGGVGSNSPCARGETDGTSVPIKKSSLAPDEPVTPYAPVYPANHVMHTDAGHIIELDDTKGAERVHIFHKAGSFYEVHPDGTMVIKSVKDAYEAVIGNKTVYVKGDCKIQVAGSCTVNANKALSLTSQADINIAAKGKVNIASGADMNLGASGKLNLIGTGDAYLNGAEVRLGEGSLTGSASVNSPAESTALATAGAGTAAAGLRLAAATSPAALASASPGAVLGVTGSAVSSLSSAATGLAGIAGPGAAAAGILASATSAIVSVAQTLSNIVKTMVPPVLGSISGASSLTAPLSGGNSLTAGITGTVSLPGVIGELPSGSVTGSLTGLSGSVTAPSLSVASVLPVPGSPLTGAESALGSIQSSMTALAGSGLSGPALGAALAPVHALLGSALGSVTSAVAGLSLPAVPGLPALPGGLGGLLGGGGGGGAGSFLQGLIPQVPAATAPSYPEDPPNGAGGLWIG